MSAAGGYPPSPPAAAAADKVAHGQVGAAAAAGGTSKLQEVPRPPPGAAPRKLSAQQVAGKCTFFLVGKGRHCRFGVTPGTDRCGVHGASEEERVPCPLDPGHTVFKSQLAHHVKICSKKHQEEIYTRQPFFARGVNLEGAAANSSTAHAAPEEAAEVATQAAPALEADLVASLAEAFPRAARQLLGEACDPEELLECSLAADGEKLDDHAGKHEVQNAALVEVILERGIADSEVVVEYGCGRAGLGAAILAARAGTRCVLVDREAPRHKLDNKRQNRSERVLRLRLDIADFDLATLLGQPLDPAALPQAADFQCQALSVSSRAVPADEGGEQRKNLGPAEQLEQQWKAAAALQAQPPWPPEGVLACAKHLCGGATDIALRSLRRCGRLGRLGARVCIATCCHMRCDFLSYVNVPFLQSFGLARDQEEFARLAALAGCAFGGRENVRERRRSGLMAKRMLDLGRLAWCRDALGLPEVRLINYVGKEVTPENMAIVAGGPPQHAA